MVMCIEYQPLINNIRSWHFGANERAQNYLTKTAIPKTYFKHYNNLSLGDAVSDWKQILSHNP